MTANAVPTAAKFPPPILRLNTRKTTRLAAVVFLAGIAPAQAADRSVSDLFDPAVIVRSICNAPEASPIQMPGQQLAAEPSLVIKKGTRPPLWPGLGTLTFKIATTKPEAQAYFDQGLRLTYGFNHGEAIRASAPRRRSIPNAASAPGARR